MIRLLQKDNRAVKVLFAVIIGAAILSMIVYLIPGLYEGVSDSGDGVYASVHQPGLMGRIFGDSEQITTQEVSRLAQSLQQRSGYPAFYLPLLERQAQQMKIAWAIEDQEASRLGLLVSDADVSAELHQGQLGQLLFPNGQFIGQEQYKQFVQNAAGVPTTADFEKEIKEDLERRRLRQFVTAGVNVNDNAVRSAYLLSGTKVKFDYAMVSPEDVKKNVTSTDSELQKYFNDNKARYAKAVPEARKLTYVAVAADSLPGGKPQVSDADVQSYYNQHTDQYKVEEQVKVRHILISVPPGADAKVDAAAKTKAQDLLTKIRAGGNFADLAKANSDDPGSKGTGGELGWVKANGQMVPAFQTAAMALKAGQTSDLVKTQFGYHILQATERQEAHVKPLTEVASQIRPMLEQQKAATAEQNFVTALSNEAAKQGLEKTAAAHHLTAQTTDYVAQDGVVNGVADSSQLLQAAFAAKKGDAPKAVATGEGMAIFQVLDIQPAHTPTFDAWKSHVADDYAAEQVPTMMQAKLTKLSERAKQLNDLKKAAAEMNIPVKTSDLVGRDGNVPELGAMSGGASVAFTLAKGAVSGPVDASRSGAVLQVVDKQEPTTEDIAKNFDKTKNDLLENKRNEVFALYMGTLMDQYKAKGGIHLSAKSKANQAPNPLGL